MRTVFFSWCKVKWMIFTLVVPEALLTKAITDLYSCLLHSPILQELADEDGVPWSKTHTFLADMGGFALRFTPPSELIECHDPSAPSDDVEAERRLPLQEDSAETAIKGQQSKDATGKLQDQARGQESGPIFPNLSSTGNPQCQERLARFEASDSAQSAKKHGIPPDELATSGEGSAAQWGLVDDMSENSDLPRLLSATEQHNRQAASSTEAVQQELQPASAGEAAAKTWYKSPRWREERRRFKTRVETASRHFDDIEWGVSRHNSTNMANIFPAQFDSMNGSSFARSTLLTLEGDVRVLTAAQLNEARRRKLIARLPHITEDEISDRDKGDVLIKLLALMQVSWMVIHITRATLHLSSAPLEIMTLSFAACAFITYILLLNHPQDVTTSTYIDACRLSTVYDMHRIAALSPTFYLRYYEKPSLGT